MTLKENQCAYSGILCLREYDLDHVSFVQDPNDHTPAVYCPKTGRLCPGGLDSMSVCIGERAS
ncbi:MAG: hypothetical protein ABIH59_02395 [archaeon]